MATVIAGVSRTFHEYLLLPGRTSPWCTPDAVDLTTALTRHSLDRPPGSTLRLPISAAIMQAVASPELAGALGRAGGLGFAHHNQSISAQVSDVRATSAGLGGTGPVAAGINTRDYRERVPALVDAGATVLCVDSSDGFTDWQFDTLRWTKTHHPEIPVGGGNVVDRAGFTFLADAGADFVKVGIGGGSICTTREQKGIGRGQATALLDVAGARDAWAETTGEHIPLCCDGGLLHDHHLALALAMGADWLMLGRYFARCDEAPGRRVVLDGIPHKEYWGEGSARAASAARYQTADDPTRMLFEEGVDGYVPYAGPLAPNLVTTVAKITATMVSCGVTTLADFRRSAKITLVSEQSYLEAAPSVLLRERNEARPHDRR